MRSAREPDPRSVRAGTKTGYAGDADAATWRKTGKLKRDAAADYRSTGRQTGPEAPQASSVDIVIDMKVREPRAELAPAIEAHYTHSGVEGQSRCERVRTGVLIVSTSKHAAIPSRPHQPPDN